MSRQDWQTKPWKNGGGVTHDIITDPAGAGFDSFIWRLSAAEVAQDGPFSLFVGIDRSMVILSGDGLELSGVPGAPMCLRCETAPFAFPGDVAVTSRLLGGPVLDMNLMTRRTDVAHAMSRIVLTGRLDLAAEPVTLVHLESGNATVSDADGRVQLASGDTAVCRTAATLEGQGARLLLMEITARR